MGRGFHSVGRIRAKEAGKHGAAQPADGPPAPPDLLTLNPFGLRFFAKHLLFPAKPKICIPVRTLHSDARHQGPALKNWIHEIKHDGYRLIVQREGQRVRLWTRNGHDWTEPLSADR